MNSIAFVYPLILVVGVLILAVMIWFVIKKDKSRYAAVIYSDNGQFSKRKKTLRLRLRLLPGYIRILLVAILTIACARPQISLTKDNKNIEGIDIVIALDVSPSMLAEDFKPNRLESAKKVAKQFIDNRKNDEIGLVVFSGEAYTQCPPTIDHNVLSELLEQTKIGELEDGTAIGDGLATAVNRIKDSKAKSKVIILITDGVNNTGQIDPLTAASFAKQYGIRVYTVGVGSMDTAPFPYQTPFGKQYQNVKVEIDETLLKNIASNTGAEYFRSTKNASLENIFKEIDGMEKSIINVALYKQKKDVGQNLIIIAFCLLLAECLLRWCVVRCNY